VVVEQALPKPKDQVAVVPEGIEQDQQQLQQDRLILLW